MELQHVKQTHSPDWATESTVKIFRYPDGKIRELSSNWWVFWGGTGKLWAPYISWLSGVFQKNSFDWAEAFPLGSIPNGWITDTGACYSFCLSSLLLRLQVLQVLVLLPVPMLPAHSSAQAVVGSPIGKGSSHVPIPCRSLSPAPVKSSFTHPCPSKESKDILLQGLICALRSTKSPLTLGNYLISQGHLRGFKLRKDKKAFKKAS